MQGIRLPDGQAPKNPGEYSWMPYLDWEYKPSWFLGPGEWHVIDPTGGIGAIGRVTSKKPAAHTWIIHNDETVSFTPSLVMPSGWHGFLINGVFTSV